LSRSNNYPSNIDKATEIIFSKLDPVLDETKNFLKQWYTKPMLHPFQHLPNNALGHYNTQLPLYGKLLLKMLEGTKYENIKLLGCIIVRLTDEGEFVEHRVDKSTINTILDMDIKPMLKKIKK
jgi:hypothetical protein